LNDIPIGLVYFGQHHKGPLIFIIIKHCNIEEMRLGAGGAGDL